MEKYKQQVKKKLRIVVIIILSVSTIVADGNFSEFPYIQYLTRKLIEWTKCGVNVFRPKFEIRENVNKKKTVVVLLIHSIRWLKIVIYLFSETLYPFQRLLGNDLSFVVWPIVGPSMQYIFYIHLFCRNTAIHFFPLSMNVQFCVSKDFFCACHLFVEGNRNKWNQHGRFIDSVAVPHHYRLIKIK